MVLKASWSDLPETEGLPNNFRKAVLGKEMGVNLIRWVHPTELPAHVHEDAEQALIMQSGSISFNIGEESMILREGDVAIVPRGVVHSGCSIEGEATFIEVFAPGLVSNLPGFLGSATISFETEGTQ